MVEFVSSCTIRNYISNWGSVINADLALLRRTTLAAFSTDGANVVIGCPNSQIRVHEVLVRNFTTLLDFLSPGEVSEARDPYGNLTLILPDADRETLQCLAEMLYRGVTSAPNARVKAKLMEVTKLTVSLTRGRPKKTSATKWPKVDFCQDPLTSQPNSHTATIASSKPGLEQVEEVELFVPGARDTPEDGQSQQHEDRNEDDHAANDDWQDEHLLEQDEEVDSNNDSDSCSFLQNFDVDLVSSPHESIHPAGHYVRGRHPYWKPVYGVQLLIDPLGGTVKQGKRTPQAIAYWDTKQDKAYFFNNGFLLVSSTGAHTFDLQPVLHPKITAARSIHKDKGGTEGPSGCQAKTKAAVLSYTEEFNPLDYLEDGSHIIKDIFHERTLTPTSSDNASANRRELFSWFLGHYYRGYEKRFSFTRATLEAKIWPGNNEARILLRNLEKAVPGLTIRYNKAGKEMPLPIQTQFIDKMGNDNSKRLEKMRRLKKGNANVIGKRRPGTSSRKSTPSMSDAKKRKLFGAMTEEFEDFNSRPTEEGSPSFIEGTSQFSSQEYLSGPDYERFDFETC